MTYLTVPNIPLVEWTNPNKLEHVTRVHNFNSLQVSVLCFYMKFYHYSLLINFYCHDNITNFYKTKAKLNTMLWQPLSALLQDKVNSFCVDSVNLPVLPCHIAHNNDEFTNTILSPRGSLTFYANFTFVS